MFGNVIEEYVRHQSRLLDRQRLVSLPRNSRVQDSMGHTYLGLLHLRGDVADSDHLPAVRLNELHLERI